MNFSSRILVASFGFMLVTGCGSNSNNNPAAAPAKAANVKDVWTTFQGACTGQALPEIRQADGTEVSFAKIPAGEYDYLSGEIFVFSQGTDSSKVEALVQDKAAENGGPIQANLNCNHVVAQDVAQPSALAKQMAPTDPVAQSLVAQASASPSPAPSIVNAPTAELDAYLKMIFNADGSLSIEGLRTVIVQRLAGQAQFTLSQNSDAKKTLNLTVDQVKGFTLSKEIETHYYVSTNGNLTVISQQATSTNGVTSAIATKMIFAKATTAMPVAANTAPGTAQ